MNYECELMHGGKI